MLTTAEKENSSESEIEDESVKLSEEEDEGSDESIEERKKRWNTLHWHQKARIIFVFCVGFIVSNRFRGELNWKMVRYNLWWRKIPHLFIAKFDRRFLQDENGPLAAIDCFCLKEKIGYNNNNLFEEDKRNNCHQ